MAGLPRVNINVTGGISRPNLNKDGVSGYVFYNDNIADLSEYTTSNRIIKFTNLPSIEATGLTSTSTNFKEEYYQLKEHFRAGGAEVYVGIFDAPAVSNDFTEIETMHLFSAGEIKLYGIYNSKVDLVSTDLALINDIMDDLSTGKQPAYAFYSANTAELSLTTLPNLRGLASNLKYVSVVIGQDTKNEPLTLSVTNSVANLGVVVGTSSNAKVNENILNVGKYNYTNGIDMVEPGLFINSEDTDDTLVSVKNINSADLDALNDKGYIFWRYFPNLEGTYLSNDNNCSAITDTFNSVHIVRTSNKVIRESDIALTPLIGSTLLFNSDGTLASSSINLISSALSNILSGMVRNEEISAFDIYIDPTQNTLSTKTVNVELAIVPTESLDFITLNVSFVNQI